MGELRAQLDGIDSQQVAERLLEFVKVESPTGAEEPASRFFAQYLQQIGLEVATYEAAPGRSNVVGKLSGSGGGPTLVLNGHLDTIPAHGCVSPEIREGKVWGRGTEDMKGGLVAAAEAVRWLKDSGARLKGDVYVVGVVGHETPAGKKEGPIYFQKQIQSGTIRPDAVIILEGPRKIWAASLGYAAISIRIRAKHPSLHTFTVPVRENPIFSMGKVISLLDAANERMAHETPHPLCGRGFVQLGMVRGGDYVTRVALEVALVGTWSWTPIWNVSSVRQELERIASEVSQSSGLEVLIDMEATREPFETAASEPIVTAMQEAERKLTGQPGEVIGSALVSDAHFYRNDCNVPTIYYGPAYQTSHSDREFLSIADLTRLTKLCVLTAVEFCGEAPGNQEGI
jgi:acetylornithine deacetylase/succinyl-diaminopimelate desuccinylase-like protein